MTEHTVESGSRPSFDYALDDVYRQQQGRVFITGNQALARLPMLQQARDRASGLNTAGFISGYRGSPLGALDKTLWRAKDFLAAQNIVFQSGVNEDLAATAVWGSQQVNLFQGARYDGVFGMWYGKGPGVDRSGDVFKHGNSAGTSKHGGVLVIAGDDHGCKSSTLPHQSEYAFVDAMIPVLNPAGVQEVLDFGLHGWALSRFSGSWVAMKTIAETVDASYTAMIDPDHADISIPQWHGQDLHIRWPDKPLEQEKRLHKDRMLAVLAYARHNRLDRTTLDCPAPRIGIVSTGKSYLDVLQAMEDLGIDDELARQIGIRIYKVGLSWPLEPQGIREFAEGLREVIVVEEKRGLIEEQLTSQLYNWNSTVRPIVIGKHDEFGNWLLPSTGELTPGVISRVIANRIGRFFTSEDIEQRLAFLKAKEAYLQHDKETIERTPHFCSGCPHNTSTRVPSGSRAMGGIGCHYMATWMDRQTETFTQMGGEGATWIGQSPFTEEQHVFQNLGDGTYFHSGLLAIRASVAAGVNITYKILYNDAVAMTGGQPVDGQLSVDLMAHQLASEGVRTICIVSEHTAQYSSTHLPENTSVKDRDSLELVQEQLREISGTTCIIYDQTCAAEKRRRRKTGQLSDPSTRAFINTQVCEGCGDCGEVSNCLSLLPDETELGRKRKIDQSACNKDFSCIKGFCPSFVTIEGGSLRKPETMPVAETALSEPDLPDTCTPYGIVIAGVGGTGVTTIGAILGTAAHLDGKGASVLDMTGLAQKFGAVITHLQIANQPESIHAARIAAGGASLLLGCDLVVAASNDSIVKLNRHVARAVVNNHIAMTAEFTRDPDALFPADSMQQVIQESAGDNDTVFLDATAMAESCLGSSLYTNMILTGYAWQNGHIPITLHAITSAIELNGVDVSRNQKGFDIGRQFAAGNLQPPEQQPVSTPESLEELIAKRADMLVDYQNSALSGRYLDVITRIKAAAVGTAEDQDTLIRTAASGYFKVLAYKDEYEVARLYSGADFRKQMAETFEGEYQVSFHLAPPLIAPKDHHGTPRKVRFGGWMMHGFRLLRHFKFLRGTSLDPFGYTSDRKLERQLIEEYEGLIHFVIKQISPENNGQMSNLLRRIESVRGFGHVKMANAIRFREEISQLKNEVLNPEVNVVKILDPVLVADTQGNSLDLNEKNIGKSHHVS